MFVYNPGIRKRSISDFLGIFYKLLANNETHFHCSFKITQNQDFQKSRVQKLLFFGHILKMPELNQAEDMLALFLLIAEGKDKFHILLAGAAGISEIDLLQSVISSLATVLL